jgi:hypothetical protein
MPAYELGWSRFSTYFNTLYFKYLCFANPLTIAFHSIPVIAPANEAVGNSQTRVANSLNLLIGQGSSTAEFTSYHFEYTNIAPIWDNGKVVQSNEQWSANIEGQNVHFTDITANTKSEVFLINDQEYEVKDGKIQQEMGMAGLAWSMWPINPVYLIAVGSLKTTLVGL